jgi:hypothetical protein
MRAAVLTLLLAGCATRVDLSRAPRPGDPLPERRGGWIFSAHRGGDFCAATFAAGGINYSIDIECGKSTIIYVQTRDPKFMTPEHLSVGQTLGGAIAKGGRFVEGDSHCVVLLPSGWRGSTFDVKTDKDGYLIPCQQRLDDEIDFFDRYTP